MNPSKSLYVNTMIIDKIENIDLYFGLSNRIDIALQYLKNTPFSQKQDGRYEIDGKKMFSYIETYTLKPPEECYFESHKKYIDVQYMVSGRELVGYSPRRTLTSTIKPYDDVMDIALFETPESYSEMTFLEGMFILLYPDEGHMFKCWLGEPLTVRRAVVKIFVR